MGIQNLEKEKKEKEETKCKSVTHYVLITGYSNRLR
jgi:hypothetical protein